MRTGTTVGAWAERRQPSIVAGSARVGHTGAGAAEPLGAGVGEAVAERAAGRDDQGERQHGGDDRGRGHADRVAPVADHAVGRIRGDGVRGDGRDPPSAA